MQKTKLKLPEIVKLPNVAVKLSSEELLQLGTLAVDGYRSDLATRSDWASRNANAIKLALQVTEKKSFPWTGSSNVKFPLVTIAALQFLARIGILTNSRTLVKLEAWGADPEGKKVAKASRISTHMSYQLLEQNRNWVDDDEQAKFSASLLGCAIKKTFYDGVVGVNRSEYVPLMDFVVDYFCRDLDKAQRATHRRDVFQNEIEENVRGGLYLPMDPETEAPVIPVGQSANPMQDATDTAAGLSRQTDDNLRPYELLEQHCWMDLDGDGYQEPYVMVVRLDTKQVLRIVARFFDEGDVYRTHDREVKRLEEQAKAETELSLRSTYEKTAQKLEDSSANRIVRIVPTTHFTKYQFIPAPDGGFYGLGLGALLGPTNAAVDSLINQIIDAGTMLTTSGGFLGRGVKIKSGKQSFDPFEWKPVDGAGDDLRKNIVPLPVNTPPDILFHLLGMLVSYGEKIGSATDVMTGVNPGQNTPAETSRNTLEQGMMLFSGIYKRMYRGFGDELTKLYQLNRWFVKTMPDFGEMTKGEGALFAEDDYDGNLMRVYPSADPTSVSAAQKQNKAKVAFELMQARPNGFDPYEVTRRVLEAHEVDGIEAIFPDPKGPKAIPALPNPKVEIEKAKLEQAKAEHEDQMALGIAELKAQMLLNDAKVNELEAKAAKETAEAAGVQEGHALAMIQAQIGAAKVHREGLMKVLDVMQRHHAANQKNAEKSSKQENSNDKKPKADA